MVYWFNHLCLGNVKIEHQTEFKLIHKKKKKNVLSQLGLELLFLFNLIFKFGNYSHIKV